MSKGKYILQLNNFSPIETLKKYGLIEDDDNFEIIEDIYKEPTLDIMQDKSIKNRYFLDSKKNKIKSWLHMIDFTMDGPMPAYTNLPCKWCKDIFVTCPLGIPIHYWSKRSNSSDRAAVIKKCRALNIEIEEEDFNFFETEGIFCSFPCAKAYILNKKSNPRYKNSLTNLTLLFKKIYDEIEPIPIASDWEHIDRWGGHLTIEQFRSSFGRMVYEKTINVMKPIMFPISNVSNEVKV